MTNHTDIVRSLYDSFARGDVPAVLGTMDPEIAWREAEGNPYQPSGEPFVGPNAIVESLFAKLATEWDGFSVHPATYHEAGGAVVVEGRYRGTHKATGRALDAQFCHVWRVAGDKIGSFQQYTDTGQFQGIMGSDR